MRRFSASFWFVLKRDWGCSFAEAFDLSNFKQLVVFGDSLSDNGNAYFLTAGQDPPSSPYNGGRWSNPSAPYYEGRWSDGPIWVDYFPSVAGADLPEPITPFFVDPNNGTNVAVGGSTSSPVVRSSSTFAEFFYQAMTGSGALPGGSLAFYP